MKIHLPPTVDQVAQVAKRATKPECRHRLRSDVWVYDDRFQRRRWDVQKSGRRYRNRFRWNFTDETPVQSW